MKFDTKWTLIAIFLIAVYIRLLYLPYDINFAYDQARDLFDILKLIGGDLKFIGPPSTFEGINHGVLFYYLAAPFLLLTKNPIYLSIFLRILNASGVFLIFKIGKNLFTKNAGLIAALMYAISFEETQFAIFLGHPSLAIITDLLFILGASEVVFNKNSKGLILASFGMGLSLQAHFSMIFLFPAAFVMFITFRKIFVKINKNIWLISMFIIISSVIFYFLPGVKNGFKNITSSALLADSLTQESRIHLITMFRVAARFFKFNILNYGTVFQITLMNVTAFIILFKYLNLRSQTKFLLIWFILGLATFLAEDPNFTRFVSAMGVSATLILVYARLISFFSKNKKIFIAMLCLIFFSNFYLIETNNPKGTIAEINAQPYMLLPDQKQIIDYTYREAQGEPFSINAVTVPYNIFTTWSYLYEWYGQEKYGYLPVWAGDPAEGFNGNLKVLHARSEGPKLHFTIIEPKRGLNLGLVKRYINEENIFTRPIREKRYGEIIVQQREPY